MYSHSAQVSSQSPTVNSMPFLLSPNNCGYNLTSYYQGANLALGHLSLPSSLWAPRTSTANNRNTSGNNHSQLRLASSLRDQPLLSRTSIGSTGPTALSMSTESSMATALAAATAAAKLEMTKQTWNPLQLIPFLSGAAAASGVHHPSHHPSHHHPHHPHHQQPLHHPHHHHQHLIENLTSESISMVMPSENGLTRKSPSSTVNSSPSSSPLVKGNAVRNSESSSSSSHRNHYNNFHLMSPSSPSTSSSSSSTSSLVNSKQNHQESNSKKLTPTISITPTTTVTSTSSPSTTSLQVNRNQTSKSNHSHHNGSPLSAWSAAAAAAAAAAYASLLPSTTSSKPSKTAMSTNKVSSSSSSSPNVASSSQNVSSQELKLNKEKAIQENGYHNDPFCAIAFNCISLVTWLAVNWRSLSAR